MGEYTPGPWFAHPVHVRDNYRASKPLFGDGLWHVRQQNDPDTCPIAEIDRGDDRDGPTRLRAEADARLMASAPDLLEALVNLFAHPGTHHGQCISHDTVGCDCDYSEVANAARAAISKATGSTLTGRSS